LLDVKEGKEKNERVLFCFFVFIAKESVTGWNKKEKKKKKKKKKDRSKERERESERAICFPVRLIIEMTKIVTIEVRGHKWGVQVVL
jgi:hypothetical protein